GPEGERGVSRREERAGAPGDEDRAAAREDRGRGGGAGGRSGRRGGGLVRLHGGGPRHGRRAADLADREFARRLAARGQAFGGIAAGSGAAGKLAGRERFGVAAARRALADGGQRQLAARRESCRA